MPPGRPERRDDRPVLAGRTGATSGRSSPRRAPTRTSSRRWRGPAIRYFGSDTTRIFCLPTCHDARRVTDRHLVHVPLGRARRTAPATGRASTAGRPRRRARPEHSTGRVPSRAVARDSRGDLLDSANLGPADYANGRAHDRPRRAPPSGSRSSSSTSSGARPTSGSGSRSRRSRRSSWRRPGSLLAGLIMLGAVAIVRRGALVRPSRRELRDAFIVGALLMGGGMGLVAWGEQTVPSGIAGAPDRDDAGLGRDLRPDLLPRAPAGWRRRRHRDRHRSASRSSSARRSRSSGSLDPAGHRRPAPLADRLGGRLAVRGARRAAAPRPVRHDRHPDALRRARPGASPRSRPASWPASTRRRSPASRSSRSST